MTTTYFHATTRANLSGILAHGLLVSKAQGKEPAIWLHTPSKVHWAIAHTQKRHGGSLEDVVILEVQVTRRALRRAWTSLWKCYRDIPPHKITLRGTGATFAASPLEE